MKSVSMKASERGSILIVGLILLVVMTLLAVSAIKMSTLNLRILNGAQAQSEARWAAQNALDRVVNTNFATDIGGVAGTYNVPIDAGRSYSVTVGRPCLKQVRLIMNSELNTSNDEDRRCFDTTTKPYSACASTVWQLSASTTEGFLGARASLTQGVGVRMDSATAMAYSTSTSPVYTCP